jgi:Domain of unknown function (DUF4878)
MKRSLVVLLAFSALYISSCKTGGGDPKAVLNSFFEAMAKKDIAEARKLATADSKSMFDLMEMGLKMKDSMNDQPMDQFDKNKMEMGEAKIDGDKATVNVKEKKSGESVNFILKKEGGAWKVAMDMSTLMSMGAEKMNEKGMDGEDMEQMKEQMEKFKNMNPDSLKMIMEKGIQALDTMKNLMEKK